MRNGQVIALGSINVDCQVRTERWPRPGETVIGKEFLLAGGGKAANRAYLARRLGVQARLLGKVGDDDLARYALQPLQEQGVDLRAVGRARGHATAVSMIIVRPDGEKTIILAANANDAWQAADAATVVAAIEGAPAGSVLTVDLEISPFIVQHALDAARRLGYPVVLDPSPAARCDPAWYRTITCLTPNPAEAEQLTGLPVRSPEEALQAGTVFLEQGVQHALVKLQHGGCVVVNRHLRAHIPSMAVDVVDTTGAGDAFAGALAVALLEGYDMGAAARVAVTAAALTVTRYGSQKAYPSRHDLERWLSNNVSLRRKGV